MMSSGTSDRDFHLLQLLDNNPYRLAMVVIDDILIPIKLTQQSNLLEYFFLSVTDDTSST